jgi:peptidyl-prolyl cis-trans isomerase C
MKTTLPTLLTASLLALAGISARGQDPAAAQLFADPVLAKGKDFTIKRSQVEEAFLKFKANAAAQGQAIPEAQRNDVERRILDRLITMQVVGARATEDDKAEAKEKADKFMGEAMEQATSEAAFRRQLLAMGLTEAEFKADILERAIVEQVIERELRPQAVVTEADVKKFYDENPSRFEQPETVKMQHIHVSTMDPATRRELPAAEKTKKRELIDQTLTRARAGEDFAKLVNDVSDDVRTKERGGEYTVARGTMEPVFAGVEAAAFSLRPGQISDVLVSAFGFHIVKQIERTPARQIPYSEVSERIRDALIQQEVQKLLPEYLEGVKKEAGVEVVEAPQP